MTNLYALGWTEHSVGSQNIRSMAIIQLLLGNMGMAGGGINALRGHANVQGITDFALYAQNLPGYLAVPSDAEPDCKTFLEKKTPKMLRPGQMNFGQNLPKWYVSLHKAWWGDAATKDNGFAYDFMPKLAGASDVLSDLRPDVPGQGPRLPVPGLQPAGLRRQQEEGVAMRWPS